MNKEMVLKIITVALAIARAIHSVLAIPQIPSLEEISESCFIEKPESLPAPIESDEEKHSYNLDSAFSVYSTPELAHLKNKNISIYCAESQNRITHDPSYSITWAEGTYVDPKTGIRKNSQGDYLCAMGTKFGQVGDRFLILCENDQSFTIQLGDSKGDKWYDVYGDFNNPQLAPLSGYCLIEFIVDMPIALEHIRTSGSYHTTGAIPIGIQYIVPLS